MQSSYIFVGVLGTSPAVVTETLWAYARQQHPPKFPTKVHILTTHIGEATFRAAVMGEARTHPKTGAPLQQAHVWEVFCDAVLDGSVPEIIFHVAQNSGGHDADIRTADEDQRFGEMCYGVIRDVMNEAKELPVVGSLAGGRKTMSAHLMNAFSLFARNEDTLVHVLVNPPSFEMDRSFFYPKPEHEFVQIDLVHLQFPRLRPHLNPDTLDMKMLMKQLPTLQPQNTTLRFTRIQKRMQFTLEDHNGSRETVMLSASLFAMLYVLLEKQAIETDFDFKALHRLRQEAYEMTQSSRPLKQWNDNQDVSKAFSQLKAALKPHPQLSALLNLNATTRPTHTTYSRNTDLPKWIYPP